MDSVVLKKGQILEIHNKVYLIKRDTVFVIPASIHYSIKADKGDLFYSTLEQRLNKRKWTKELHNVIITSAHKKNSVDSLTTTLSTNQFILYEGRPIRHIKLLQLDVFGPTLTEPSRTPNTWIERTGNKFHFTSKKYLIKNNLLFKEGENVDAITLADNERVLRGLPYIDDALISVQSAGELNDSVDVVVMTKDVWSQAFDVDINDIYSGKLMLWDRNILGFGHEIQNNIPWDSRETKAIGYEGNYVINNIAGSFIKGKFSYVNSFRTESFGLSLDRSFFTPNIKYAGGFLIENSNTQTSFKVDTSFRWVPLKYTKYDGWVGRSFAIGRKDAISKARQNITFTARVSHDRFRVRPEISSDSYYQYQNKTLILNSISFSRQSFFKSNLIYNYGRTEDIPVGFQLLVTMGAEKNEFFKRNYFSGSLMAGQFFGNFGYLYTSTSIGSFVYLNDKPEQGIFSASVNYVSPLLTYKRFNFRQFVTTSYTKGINRFSNEHLTINEGFGITGFTNDSTLGNRRFNMHWETVCFTPWYAYDFRFVLFLFADHSWIKNGEGSIFDKWPYTGIGFGVRIHNERLVFNTIQIRFTIYPNIPQYSTNQLLNISGEPLLNPPSFSPKAPDLLIYQ